MTIYTILERLEKLEKLLDDNNPSNTIKERVEKLEFDLEALEKIVGVDT